MRWWWYVCVCKQGGHWESVSVRAKVKLGFDLTERGHRISIMHAYTKEIPHAHPYTHLYIRPQEEHQKGNNLYRNRQFERAIRVYTRALMIDPDNDCYCAIVFANRAAAALALNKFKQVSLSE